MDGTNNCIDINNWPTFLFFTKCSKSCVKCIVYRFQLNHEKNGQSTEFLCLIRGKKSLKCSSKTVFDFWIYRLSNIAKVRSIYAFAEIRSFESRINREIIFKAFNQSGWKKRSFSFLSNTLNTGFKNTLSVSYYINSFEWTKQISTKQSKKYQLQNVFGKTTCVF